MKKILYLHGLESTQGGNKVSFLSSKGTVYAPVMDYTNLDLNNFIKTLETPDLIIGSSMGGYIADIIGSQLGIDVLLFNPALHSRNLDFPEFANVEYNTSNTYKRTIILGMEDEIIDPEKTKSLWPVGHNIATFEEIEDMGHRTLIDVFVNMYNKHA
jgi:predicted esterase YcpF (UPF0227 family)